MHKLLESINQVATDTVLTLETPPESPLDTSIGEETRKDFEDMPLFTIGIPLPPGTPPASALYTSEATDHFSEETEPVSLHPTSIIIISPETPEICCDYQQGMCQNVNCKYAHEVDTAELRKVLARFLKASAWQFHA